MTLIQEAVCDFILNSLMCVCVCVCVFMYQYIISISINSSLGIYKSVEIM